MLTAKGIKKLSVQRWCKKGTCQLKELYLSRNSQTFQETFNETFVLQFKPNTKRLKEIKCETTKVIKDYFQNKWKQKAV